MRSKVCYKKAIRKAHFIRKPSAADLFSGCGGLTEGLKQAGFNVLGAIDVDPLSVDTYKLNHPKVHVIKRDIRNVSTKTFMQILHIKKGQLDLLAGCPPCQGFSSLRTLNGSKDIIDDRNDLVFDFYRFVKDLRPKLIMMENVPALAADKRLEIFCQKITRLGYKYKVLVLDAADFGVPQRRKRMILLAGLRKEPRFAQLDRNRKTVEQTISELPEVGLSGDPLHDIYERRSERIKILISKIPHDGGSRISLGKDNQLECHKNFDGFKDIYGRMAWKDISPTITTGCTNPSKGRFLHPSKDRAITLREAALLQTFPRNYKFSLTKGKVGVATLIGNALPPELIRRHADELLHFLGSKRKKGIYNVDNR